jgi:hypothetical protein
VKYGRHACISKTALPPNTLAPTTSRDRTRSQSFSLLATSFEFVIRVYWERNLQAWDMAAGAILIKEAGGVVSCVDGESDPLKTGNLICGNEYIHAEPVRSCDRRGSDDTLTCRRARVCAATPLGWRSGFYRVKTVSWNDQLTS